MSVQRNCSFFLPPFAQLVQLLLILPWAFFKLLWFSDSRNNPWTNSVSRRSISASILCRSPDPFETQFLSSVAVGQIYRMWDDKASSTTGTFPAIFLEPATKVWYRRCPTWSMRIVFEIVSSQKTGLFCIVCWNDYVNLPYVLWVTSVSSYHYLTVFSAFVFPYSLQITWIFSPPLLTSENSGTAHFHKSAPTFFQLGQHICVKMEQ